MGKYKYSIYDLDKNSRIEWMENNKHRIVNYSNLSKQEI